MTTIITETEADMQLKALEKSQWEAHLAQQQEEREEQEEQDEEDAYFEEYLRGDDGYDPLGDSDY